MTLDNEWVKLNVAQKISIAELKAKNKELIIQLEDAGIEIAKLKLEVTKLENGQLALNIKLIEATNEIGRLSLLLGQ